jgi:hypothetical protein
MAVNNMQSAEHQALGELTALLSAVEIEPLKSQTQNSGFNFILRCMHAIGTSQRIAKRAANSSYVSYTAGPYTLIILCIAPSPPSTQCAHVNVLLLLQVRCTYYYTMVQSHSIHIDCQSPFEITLPLRGACMLRRAAAAFATADTVLLSIHDLTAVNVYVYSTTGFA